jgi:DNA-directed RNA polymerase specialized sigma24 family protein
LRFPSPAGSSIQGDPVGTADDVGTDAAEELFRTVYPKLAGWVRRLVDDDDTARDRVGGVRPAAVAVDEGGNPQSYLYMIAANLIRDHWRKAAPAG